MSELYSRRTGIAVQARLYHATSLAALDDILQNGVFRSNLFVSFSEEPLFGGDISSSEVVVVVPRSALGPQIIPVQYTENWYMAHPEQAAYIAGKGWQEQHIYEPDMSQNDEDWEPDPDDEEASYRDAELSAFMVKSDEREWISREEGIPITLPVQSLQLIVNNQSAMNLIQQKYPDVPVSLDSRRIAAYPPLRGLPQHDAYPGDTVHNESAGFNEPFGRKETGVESPPGARGELLEGRPPGDIGVPIPIYPNNPQDNAERKEKIPPIYRARKAFDVARIPMQPTYNQDLGVLQIPKEVHEKYSDLVNRVTSLARELDLPALDVYTYKVSPPREWVEAERQNSPVDWEDTRSWNTFAKRLKHDDVNTWFGFSSLSPEQIRAVAPALHDRFTLEAGGGNFSDWFLGSRPDITRDPQFVSALHDTVKKESNSGIGKDYSTYWRSRNLGRSYKDSYAVAKERWLEHVRQKGMDEFVNPEHRERFDIIRKLHQDEGPVSVHDLIGALKDLPLPDDYKKSVGDYEMELTDLVNQGLHALDLYREPVSANDRQYGDISALHEQWIPVRSILTPLRDTAINSRIAQELDQPADILPIAVYQYGNKYFLVHEVGRDVDVLAAAQDRGLSYIFAHVYTITPGSSIKKFALNTHDGFLRRSKALAQSIWEIEAGADKESTFLKYSREFGPRLPKAVHDYLYIQQQSKESSNEDTPSSSGGSCETFWNEQSADGCNGCTYNTWGGGGNDSEPGYGDTGGCLLTHLFLNAPEHGFSRGIPNTGVTEDINKQIKKNPRGIK